VTAINDGRLHAPEHEPKDRPLTEEAMYIADVPLLDASRAFAPGYSAGLSHLPDGTNVVALNGYEPATRRAADTKVLSICGSVLYHRYGGQRVEG
jgi:hypothetical protein